VNHPLRLKLLAIAVAASLVGCTGGQTLPEKGPKTAQAVLEKALALPLPKTLQGMSRLDSYVKGEARKGDVLLLLERPGKAQFKVLTPTLDLIAALTTDGSRFSSFQRGHAQCHVGEACAANIARLVPIALPPKQMVDAMLGLPPLIDSPKRKLGWDSKRGAYKVRIGPTKDGTTQDVWVRPNDFRILAAVIEKGGKRVASIAYTGHDDVAKMGPPKVMRMLLPAKQIDMSLTLRDVELNAPIEADVFAPTCPTGTVAIELPCQAAGPVLQPPAPARSQP